MSAQVAVWDPAAFFCRGWRRTTVSCGPSGWGRRVSENRRSNEGSEGVEKHHRGGEYFSYTDAGLRRKAVKLLPLTPHSSPHSRTIDLPPIAGDRSANAGHQFPAACWCDRVEAQIFKMLLTQKLSPTRRGPSGSRAQKPPRAQQQASSYCLCLDRSASTWHWAIVAFAAF